MRANNVDAVTKSESRNDFPSPFDILTPFCVAGYACASQPLNSTSVRFNPYFGYNYQIGPQWLVGLEGDYGFGSKTTTLDGMTYPGGGLFGGVQSGSSFAVKMGWDAGVRARVGYLPAPDFLVYATGGPAWQHVESTATCGGAIHIECGPGNGSLASSTTDSTTKMGYSVGAGIEALLWSHWMLRGEFRYSNFGTITNTDTVCASGQNCAPGTALTTSYALKATTETATLGLAYKF